MFALVGDAFGGVGGIAQYNRDFFSGLAATGEVGKITVVPRNVIPPIRSLPPEISQLQAQRSRLGFVLAALRQAKTGGPIDVVFCGHLRMAGFAAKLAWLKSSRLIVQLHGYEAWDRPSRRLVRACERAALVLSVSRYTRQRFLAWSRLSPERVVVIPNTVDEAYTPGSDHGLRTHLGLQGKRVLLTVGRLDPRERYKGHDCVIRILPMLKQAGLEVIYVIAGSGDDQGRLERLASEYGVRLSVIFAGNVPPGELPDYYRMSDLFVMPSTREGFGIVYLEALASGTPSLGLRAGGTPDPLLDGKLGFLSAQTDQALADSVVQALRKNDQSASDLPTVVARHFGRDAFNDQCKSLVRRLQVT